MAENANENIGAQQPEEQTPPEVKEAEAPVKESLGEKRRSAKLEKELKAEKEKSAKLTEELAAEHDKHLRVLAEYDNYRKRSAKEREALWSDVRGDTIVKLLPVYDNLERALKQETADAAFYKGIEMTMTQLMEILQKMGVTPIEAVGQQFDPAVHNAVMHIDDENYGENEIVDEFQKGFKLGDKVIRFSMVRVAN